MEKNNKIALAEVNEVLIHTDPELTSKIPPEVMKFIKNNMDKEYICDLKPGVDLTDQPISDKAKDILIGIYKKYY